MFKDRPKSRVAVETFGSHGLFVIGGEVTTLASFNAEKIARKIYRDIGYKDKPKVVTNIIKQSPDIAQGVNTGGAKPIYFQTAAYGHFGKDNLPWEKLD